MGWISECDRLSIIRVEENYVLNASAMSTEVSTRGALYTPKFRMVEELGCLENVGGLPS